MMKRAAYPARPPRERGTWRALALAVVMHALLAAFLFFGIHWKNSSPTGSEAELWTDTSVVTPPTPVPVAPAPVQPAPPPPPVEDADIALQQAKRKQIEQQQKEAALLAEQQKQAQLKLQQQEAARQKDLADQQAALARQKAARDAADKAAQAQAAKQAQLDAEKRKQLDQKQQQLAEQQKAEEKAEQQKADQAKADQQKAAKAKQEADAKAKAAADQARHARLAALQGAAGGGETTGTGAGTTGSATGAGGNGSPGYAEKVRQRVKPNITFSGAVDGNPAAIVSVSCAPDGTILSSRISSSSGNQAWDDAVLRAVQASDPMPRDIDGKAPRSFQIRFRPKD
jgi:colicin import membrane protein